MHLPYHDRYPYSGIKHRQPYSWPEGRSLAVYIGLNVEHFAFGTGLGHVLSTELPQPDPRIFAWRDYGNRVGIWYILDMLDELGLPAAHLMNTAVFHHCPEVIDPILKRGDEFIGHGRTNAERQGHLFEEDEARLIQTVRKEIEHFTKTTPRGWMGPWMSQSYKTPDLLKEAGFEFLMDWPADDQPLWMKTRSGPLMSVPYPAEVNDAPQLLIRHHTAREFEQMIVDQFDEMLERSSTGTPLVCGIALHTMVMGQPYRARALRRALKYITEHPQRHKVWFTRPHEIFDHCAKLPDGVMHRPV
jgi:allantoinase